MTNKYTGEVDLEICGKAVKLKFDWAAISEVMSMHGSDVLATLLQAPPTTIADVLVAGLKGQGITAAEIVAASPPLMPLIMHIDKALAYAYYGPEGRPTGPDGKKKNPPATS